VSDVRTFDSGAIRDTDQDKLSYVKGLSPLVLKRYMQYLAKHRIQTDGNLRDWDNWKAGMPQEVYLDSRMRHEMDVWLAMDGFQSEQDVTESLCAVIFNAMGQLHEVLFNEDADNAMTIMGTDGKGGRVT
jgi:hypothetical protein